MALSSAFFTTPAMRRRLKVRRATAWAAGRLRMRPATRLSLRGLTRMLRTIASASVSASRRGCEGLPMSDPLRLLVRRMPGEGAGRREFAELVADHVLTHLHGQELVAVVH